MLHTSLTVGGHQYHLHPEQDVGAIKQAAVDAANSGAGMVTFDAVGDLEVSVLVSGATSVVFESREIELNDEAEPDRGCGPDYLSFLDYDGPPWGES